jgi:hypothetical protein
MNFRDFVHRWVCVLPLTVAFIFMGLVMLRDWPLWQRAFSSDISPVSWLSSAQLWAGALLALRLGLDRSLPAMFAFSLAVALAGLALDEQFLLHEQWKFGCESWITLCHRSGWIFHYRSSPTQLRGNTIASSIYSFLNSRIGGNPD